MYQVFSSLNDLYKEIVEDKNWQGAESGLRNRYPLRFVLFENFSDFYDFVQECSNHDIFVQSIDKWMAEGFDDQMLTYSQLAKRFEEYVKSLPANDFVIAPFSEIARFYDNGEFSEFNSLVQTIRLIESPEDSQLAHQRIYVPVIGMQSKMTKFQNDPNIQIWEYRSANENDLYRLILTPGTTYGVDGLEDKYTICHNVREWIALWKDKEKVRKNIICSSKSIYYNAHHAQPDNAFKYDVCRNAYEFLTKGLGYDFGNVVPQQEDLPYWEQLASNIDIANFDFDKFVSDKFNTISLADNHVFVQTWFECDDDFSRWLLKLYVISRTTEDSYLGSVLKCCSTSSSSELFSLIATKIFESPASDAFIRQRYVLMDDAAKCNVKITELAEQVLRAKLPAIASDPLRGPHYAMKYMTSLTNSEKSLMIKWLGEGIIRRDEVENIYPDLFEYTNTPSYQLPKEKGWVNQYFSEYVKSKIANQATSGLEDFISKYNANEVAFAEWHDRFKTTKTLLFNRTDIDVYYWIDGLGVDWIPFIINVIKKHSIDGVYLNEIYIATAELPTITSVNKPKLEELSPYPLEKIGDIDTYAHTQKQYPGYIIEEFKKVEEAIDSILSQYIGKKIAFVSDHGISYAAQFGVGKSIAGIVPDHGGRCGKWEKGNARRDNNYIILSDNQTVCSLTHNSLSVKTSQGQGAHGGVTPEEVLVPIIIVSDQKNKSNISVQLISNEIFSTNPVVRYNIKGLSSVDIPRIIYNGVEYAMHQVGDNLYESEHMTLVETSTIITLHIGEFKTNDKLVIHTGAQEDDLFNF